MGMGKDKVVGQLTRLLNEIQGGRITDTHLEGFLRNPDRVLPCVQRSERLIGLIPKAHAGITNLQLSVGEPLYCAKVNGSMIIVHGKKVIEDGFTKDRVEHLQFVCGQPLYLARVLKPAGHHTSSSSPWWDSVVWGGKVLAAQTDGEVTIMTSVPNAANTERGWDLLHVIRRGNMLEALQYELYLNNIRHLKDIVRGAIRQAFLWHGEICVAVMYSVTEERPLNITLRVGTQLTMAVPDYHSSFRLCDDGSVLYVARDIEPYPSRVYHECDKVDRYGERFAYISGLSAADNLPLYAAFKQGIWYVVRGNRIFNTRFPGEEPTSIIDHGRVPAYVQLERKTGKWIVGWEDFISPHYDQIFSLHSTPNALVWGARRGRKLYEVTLKTS